MPNIFMYYTLSQFLSFNLQHSSCKLVFSISVENSVDSDRMASGSTVFSKKDNSGLGRARVFREN